MDLLPRVVFRFERNKRQLFALVCETLKYRPVLMKILENTKLQKHEKILRQDSLAQVLVYDFLLGKGFTGSNDKFKEAVLKHKSLLLSELVRIKVKAGAHSNNDLLSETAKNEVVLPRFVRVNTLKTTVKDVTDHFKKDGYIQVHTPTSSYKEYIVVIKSLTKNHFLQDVHIPELLVFAKGTDLHDHNLYKSGDIIFQDKASCIPAFVLVPPAGSEVIDCCAAPGNKTSHLAAIMQNKGKLHAFDIDAKRMTTLRMMLLRAGVLCASCENVDFLRCDPDSPEYKDVEYILVDPSCSGSGIVSRLNALTDGSESSTDMRLENLARFQLSMLVHAMRFPNVKRIVYSTCSVHQTENESVVNKALQLAEAFFKLVTVMKGIPSRGQLLPKACSSFCADKCLRLDPATDLTNGFFIAMFQKRNKVAGNVKDILNKPEAKDLIHFAPSGEQMGHYEHLDKQRHSETYLQQNVQDVQTKVISAETKTRKKKLSLEFKIKVKKTPNEMKVNKKITEAVKLKPKADKKKKKKRQHKPVTA